MEKKETDLLDHLKQALSHLDAALHVTISSLKENPNSKTMIGKVWEEFLGIFFGKVRDCWKRKQN